MLASYLVIHHLGGQGGGGLHLVLTVVTTSQLRAVGEVHAAGHQVA